MPTYPGRIEALIQVPTGGASLSASTGALSSAVTVTTPAGQYYHTTAGGISSWGTTLQTLLNTSVRQYPDNSSALQAAIGYGTWTGGAGWLMQEASGSLAAAFGSPSLSATSSPTYQNAGPATGKYAVGFDSSADAFTGGDVFDVNVGDDIVIAWVGKIPSAPANSTVLSKRAGGSGYLLSTSGGTQFVFNGYDGVTSFDVGTGSGGLYVGEWHVGIAVIDRGASTMRVGTRGLTSLTSTVGSTLSTTGMLTLANADTFTVCGNALTGTALVGFNLAALYVVTGASVGSGLSAGLSTALTNFANAINSSWSVSLSTSTGLYTVSHSFWPIDLVWTNTTQRDLAGFDRDVTYPQTAAQMATALGYGTWTSGAGYLCNESSGNLASVFGTPATLTASGTPVYSNVGARGGADKAISFSTTADYFDFGASTYNDVGSTDDLVITWVAKFSSAPSGTNFLGKGAGVQGWWLVTSGSGIRLTAINGSTYTTGDVSAQVGEWHVGIAVIDRTTAKIRIGTYGLTTGTSSVSSEVAVGAVTFTNANNLKIGNWGGGGTASTNCAYSALYVVKGSAVASGISAAMSTALSGLATHMKSQASTQQARGLWFPDCPLMIDGDPTQAPTVTDRRDSESPTGIVLSLVGNVKYRHRGLVYPAVPRSQVWDSAASTDNSSWEEFCLDTQLGQGLSYFKPGSRVQIYWDNAGTQTLLGSDANSGTGLSGWFIKGASSIEPKMTSPPWTGLWRVELGELVSNG